MPGARTKCPHQAKCVRQVLRRMAPRRRKVEWVRKARKPSRSNLPLPHGGTPSPRQEAPTGERGARPLQKVQHPRQGSSRARSSSRPATEAIPRKQSSRWHACRQPASRGCAERRAKRRRERPCRGRTDVEQAVGQGHSLLSLASLACSIQASSSAISSSPRSLTDMLSSVRSAAEGAPEK